MKTLEDIRKNGIELNSIYWGNCKDTIDCDYNGSSSGKKILSLFDGISCAMVALERAYIQVETYYSSEVDKYAIQVTKKNYPDIIQLGDIRKLGKEIPYPEDLLNGNCDLIIGGSPCQDLSIAKKNRKGLSGEKSSLFWEYVRILNDLKPKYFILENVASMRREDRDTITRALVVEPVLINAALVSAQNRKRLFWVGELQADGTYKKVEIPQPEDKGILLKDILEEGITDRLKSYCIDVNYYKGASWEQYTRKSKRQLICIGQIGRDGQGNRIYSPDGKSVALSAMDGGRGAKTGLYLIKAPNGKDMEIDESKMPHLFKEVRTEKGKLSRREIRKLTGRDSTKRGADDKKYIPQNSGKANCITTGLGIEGLLAEKECIRKLTPIECERLQCLPDRWTEKGINEKGEEVLISNTQRYKMLGNAFNVDVVAHILKYLKLNLKQKQP